jgi:hypothetical protein
MPPLTGLRISLGSVSTKRPRLRRWVSTFQAAGCRFDFSRQTVQPLVQLVRDELAAL